MAGGTGEPIRVAAAAIINGRDEMLLVRKRGSRHFMQPGGKIDAGETPVAALVRELREEIALDLPESALTYEGLFAADAANEPGRQVVADVFSVFAEADVSPQAEIEELCWMPLAGEIGVPRAQLSEDHVFPLAQARARARSAEAG
ncbi:NUDIX hydrolase [Devosia sp.]|uniref:NUDIX hydrolase n=1 Tax=Devosia sp. TaxID=1871048 RepID=UPI003A8D72A0